MQNYDKTDPLVFTINESNVPELNCFSYLLLYGGQLVARHMGFTVLNFSSPVRRRVAQTGQG